MSITRSILETARAGFEKAGFRYITILDFEWESSIHLPRIRGDGITVRKATAEDILHHFSKGHEFHDMLKKGEECMLAFYGEELAGYLWLARNMEFYRGDIEEWHLYHKNEAFLYSGWVFNRYRNKGIFSILLNETLLTLSKEGVSKVYTSTRNPYVIRSLKKLGFKKSRMIRFMKAFTLSYRKTC